MNSNFPYRKTITSVLLFSSALVMPTAQALDEDRLWLPRSYQKLYLNLKDAALAAEALNRCVSVIDATIDLEQSTESHPIFRILCRQENGRTYNEMVDGISNETLTTPRSLDAGPTPEELEQMRLEEERRKREQKQARIAKLWDDCLAAFETKSQLMINVQEHPQREDMLVPVSYSEQKVVFEFDFNAEDIAGQALELWAICSVTDERVLDLEFGRRVEE